MSMNFCVAIPVFIFLILNILFNILAGPYFRETFLSFFKLAPKFGSYVDLVFYGINCKTMHDREHLRDRH